MSETTTIPVTDLPDLGQLIGCQAKRRTPGPECAATPVTHEARFTCSTGCPPQRFFICQSCAELARRLFVGGRSFDIRCGAVGSIILLPLGGVL